MAIRDTSTNATPTSKRSAVRNVQKKGKFVKPVSGKASKGLYDKAKMKGKMGTR